MAKNVKKGKLHLKKISIAALKYNNAINGNLVSTGQIETSIVPTCKFR